MSEGCRYAKRRKVDQASWSELPSLVLERIYSFLSRSDQSNMSLVCRHWSDGFSLASNWRKFLLNLTDSMYLENRYSQIQFVKKHSKDFKHVHIVYDEYSDKIENYFEYVTKNTVLQEFFKISKRTSKLESLKIDLKNSLIYLKEPDYEFLSTLIVDFLESQSNLKRLEFHECFFQYKEGIELLKKSIEICGTSLNRLVLREFAGNEGEESVHEELLPTLFDLPHLKYLKIDHWWIFGNDRVFLQEVIERLQHYRNETVLKIWVAGCALNSRYFELMRPSKWIHLKELFPNMELEMVVHYCKRIYPKEIIINDMPLTWLEFIFDSYFPVSCKLFDYLRSSTVVNHLIFFCLECSGYSDISSGLLPFLRACKKLKLLKLKTSAPVVKLKRLLRSLPDKRPDSLEKIILTIRCDDEEIKTDQRKIVERFYPSFKRINFNFEVEIVDW